MRLFTYVLLFILQPAWTGKLWHWNALCEPSFVARRLQRAEIGSRSAERSSRRPQSSVPSPQSAVLLPSPSVQSTVDGAHDFLSLFLILLPRELRKNKTGTAANRREADSTRSVTVSRKLITVIPDLRIIIFAVILPINHSYFGVRHTWCVHVFLKWEVYLYVVFGACFVI